MLCDTCIYKDCSAIICSECKFLVSDGLIDICYCEANKFCDDKIFEDKVLIKCKYYLSRQDLFKKESKQK